MQLAGWQMVPVVLKKNGFTCAELAKRLCSFLITSGVLSNCGCVRRQFSKSGKI